MAPFDQVTVPAQDLVVGRTSSRSWHSRCLGRRWSRPASTTRSVSVNAGLPTWRCRTKELVAQSEDLDVLVAVAHGQEPQQREGVRRSEIGQAQQHVDDDVAKSADVNSAGASGVTADSPGSLSSLWPARMIFRHPQCRNAGRFGWAVSPPHSRDAGRRHDEF